MEKLQHKPVELLKMSLPPRTELRFGPSSDSELFFAKTEEQFEVRPQSEQVTPNMLKIRNIGDNLTFYLTVPEMERFPCPIKKENPGNQNSMSLYEVMITLLREWETGNSHLRIITSIQTIFGRIGQIQNEIIREDFFAEKNRGQ